MSFESHVNIQCRNAYFHLRCLARIKQFLTPACLETLIHAFITCKLDFCNSLFVGVPQYLIQRLQSVQNSAARLITGSRRYDHITPVLYDLHWLPVQQRIQFKVLLIIYKARQSQSPTYISELFTDYCPSRSLRSADSELLQVPFTRSSYIRDRAISHAGPRLWNLLPVNLRSCASLDAFKSGLKTHLFKEHFNFHGFT